MSGPRPRSATVFAMDQWLAFLAEHPGTRTTVLERLVKGRCPYQGDPRRIRCWCGGGDDHPVWWGRIRPVLYRMERQGLIRREVDPTDPRHRIWFRTIAVSEMPPLVTINDRPPEESSDAPTP